MKLESVVRLWGEICWDERLKEAVKIEQLPTGPIKFTFRSALVGVVHPNDSEETTTSYLIGMRHALFGLLCANII